MLQQRHPHDPARGPADAMDKCNCIHTILATRTEEPKPTVPEMMAVHSEPGQWDAEAGFRVKSVM